MSEALIKGFRTEKDCLLKVVTEEGNMHISWLVEGGKVLVFEEMPGNYPATSVSIFDRFMQYMHSISQVEWITEADDSVIRNTLQEYGYNIPMNLEYFDVYAKDSRPDSEWIKHDVIRAKDLIAAKEYLIQDKRNISKLDNLDSFFYQMSPELEFQSSLLVRDKDLIHPSDPMFGRGPQIIVTHMHDNMTYLIEKQLDAEYCDPGAAE
jgi:hypothetical protein